MNLTFANQELWLQAIQDRRAPQHITLIESASGIYAYGKHYPLDNELYDTSGSPVLDGSLVLDGSWGLTGAIKLIDRGARILNFDDVDYTLTPEQGNLISGVQLSEMSEYTTSYNNADGHFSEIFAVESWLAARYTLLYGFRGLSYNTFLAIFSGQIRRVAIKGTTCDVTALNNS